MAPSIIHWTCFSCISCCIKYVYSYIWQTVKSSWIFSFLFILYIYFYIYICVCTYIIIIICLTKRFCVSLKSWKGELKICLLFISLHKSVQQRCFNVKWENHIRKSKNNDNLSHCNMLQIYVIINEKAAIFLRRFSFIFFSFWIIRLWTNEIIIKKILKIKQHVPCFWHEV